MSIQNKSTLALETAWKNDINSDKIKSDEIAKKRLSKKLIVDRQLKKSHPVSFRIPDADLEAIQLKAARSGIPYQTLIKSVLHQFATEPDKGVF